MRQAQAGLSLLELLVTLAVAGIILGIAGYGLLGPIRTARAESFIQDLVQNINSARSQTMARGAPYRIVFVSGGRYTVNRKKTDGTFEKLDDQTSSAVTLGGITAGDYLDFNTRGFVQGYNASAVSKVIASMTASYPGKTRQLQITYLGLARELN